MQAWGNQESKFVIRRTTDAPTKSGVLGLLCAAMGVPRVEASRERLPRLVALQMAVRCDRPGIHWWDYHTVGAGMRMRTAEGGMKADTMLTRREYLCDASFLVVLQGDPPVIEELAGALRNPVWPLYLGRKCCPVSRPVAEAESVTCSDLLSALAFLPWRPRYEGDEVPESVDCLFDWVPTAQESEAPPETEVWYDVPISFEPPSHRPRFVSRRQLQLGRDGQVETGEPTQRRTPRPPRPRANYGNTQYRRVRQERLDRDKHLCVFCKSSATTVQHVTYRHAGGDEQIEELRSLCRLCHDAVTMIEYGLGMGLDRINPEEQRWRDTIIRKRDEIIRFRSLETRRRRLAAEEVE